MYHNNNNNPNSMEVMRMTTSVSLTVAVVTLLLFQRDSDDNYNAKRLYHYCRNAINNFIDTNFSSTNDNNNIVTKTTAKMRKHFETNAIASKKNEKKNSSNNNNNNSGNSTLVNNNNNEEVLQQERGGGDRNRGDDDDDRKKVKHKGSCHCAAVAFHVSFSRIFSLSPKKRKAILILCLVLIANCISQKHSTHTFCYLALSTHPPIHPPPSCYLHRVPYKIDCGAEVAAGYRRFG